MSDVTHLLDRAQHGDPSAAGKLLPLVYEELRRLAALDPRKAEVVKLHLFTGLQVQEVATVLEASEKTVQRDWTFARAWLSRELKHDPN